MPKFNHLDLFSGIGGFSLAAQWTWGEEHNIHSFVEIDPFCQKVLKKHWPEVPIISNIKEYKHDGTTIDLLTGGFPCQPFSCAGKQRGKEDDRYLWPEMLRVISEVCPTWIIGENVAGIINMGLDQVLSDLENKGYTCQPFILPACAINAPHRRDRVWIVANAKRKHGISGQVFDRIVEKSKTKARRIQWDIQFHNYGNNNIEFREEDKYIVCGKDDGIPSRVDRLKSLGNAIVPQVVVPIMQVIKEINSKTTHNP